MQAVTENNNVNTVPAVPLVLPRDSSAGVLQKMGSWSEDSKRTSKDKDALNIRASSPKVIRRGRPTDAPPIQQELIDRVKSEPFVKKFNLPQTETLIKDYSAALYKQIPLHGRLYVSQNYICFESKIFNIKTTEVIPFKDVTHIRKKSKKMKFSVGIHIDVGTQTYHFASFISRDKTFFLLHELWRQCVPSTTPDSNSDDDEIDDEDEDYTPEPGSAKIGKLQRSNTDAARYSKSAPASPKFQLKGESSTASMPPLSAFTLDSDSATGSPSELLQCEEIMKDVVFSATPPEPSIMEKVPAIVNPPVEELYDDERLSPNEETEDGFLESEVFHDILTETFDVSTLNFFRVFFSDRSCFARVYHEKRGDKDMSIQKWTNSAQFGMTRDIQYYAPVKVPLGPDKTRVQETQRYVLSRTRLLIETVTMMFDIPYGDSFRLEAKWLVTSPSATANTCTLQVSMVVHFVKKTWFKGKIETQSMKEVKESFKQWTESARIELAKPEVKERLASGVTALTLNTIATQAASTTATTTAATTTTTTTATPAEKVAPGAPVAVESSTSASSDTTVQHTTTPAKPGTLEIKLTSMSNLEGRKGKSSLPPSSSNKMLSLPLPSINLQALVGDKQSVLMLLVIILSFFCIYLYCKLTYLEGKFSVVENILHRHLHIKTEEL